MRIRANLIAWYRRERRDLPWRRTRDPYAIWVSETMLQQTQVRTVLPYYERFIERFPSVVALARASEDEVLHAWQGLGYYGRARRLRAGAQAVMQRHAGTIPDDPVALRALPGVGPYTAGAIASIAFERPEPVVDGNVIRVLSRLFGLRGNPARSPLKSALWELAASLVPERAARDFNQALMELGATVCTARNARCDACPCRPSCVAHRDSTVDELPELAPRPATTAVHMVAAVIRRERKVLVARIPEGTPRWTGMWHFPATEVRPRETPEAAVRRAARQLGGLDVTPEALTAVVRHAVTRYPITLDAYRCSTDGARSRSPRGVRVAWKAPHELSALAMPSAHRRIADRLVRDREPERD